MPDPFADHPEPELVDLRDQIAAEPDAFTPWLPLALDVVERHTAEQPAVVAGD